MFKVIIVSGKMTTNLALHSEYLTQKDKTELLHIFKLHDIILKFALQKDGGRFTLYML